MSLRPARGLEPDHGRPASIDTGSASIWIVGVALIAWTAAAAVLLVGVAVATRHRAATAADLGALAGAQTLTEALLEAQMAAGSPIGGQVAPSTASGSACERARQIATADGADAVQCAVSAGIVDVVVSVRLPRLVTLAGRLVAPQGVATARARAGPVGAAAGSVGRAAVLEQHAEQCDRARLVERVVAAAALG